MKIALLGAPGSGKTQLAYELTQRLRTATAGEDAVDVLITDAPPLMAAIYADLLHNDQTRYALALTEHKIYDLTLVSGLDIPGSSGRQQHDGPASREAVDARLRFALTRGKIAYAVIYGRGLARVDAALKAIASLRDDRAKPNASNPGHWQWSCEKCSDPECEHRLFTGLLKIGNRERC